MGNVWMIRSNLILHYQFYLSLLILHLIAAWQETLLHYPSLQRCPQLSDAQDRIAAMEDRGSYCGLEDEVMLALRTLQTYRMQ